MRFIKKIMMILTVFLIVVACGQKKQIFLEKDGTLYNIGEQVSFYYPKDFHIDTTNENKNIVRFVGENEVITYSTMKDDTENEVTDMPKLYAGQLEEDGASNVKYNNMTLNSGIQCQVFTGIFDSSGIKFKHVVYFTANATYSFSYEATQDIYDENIGLVNQYLETLTVHHDIVTSLE